MAKSCERLGVRDPARAVRGRAAPWLMASVIATLLGAAPFAARGAEAAASDPRELLTQYKCYLCHADHEARTGPAYDAVAAHFRDRRDAVSTIARDIRRGMRGGGPWHMPPHPEVTTAEARAMAKYIMSLDGPESRKRGTAAPGE